MKDLRRPLRCLAQAPRALRPWRLTPRLRHQLILLTNKSSIITAAGLSTTILPATSPDTPHDNQTVKARREVVPRAISSVSQTRVWNVLIDVVAQSGHYKPNAISLQNDRNC